ncbi:hypothetical protein [Nodosilinea nodulosa]|uniref:hypothetical protein n=1 Tax=Nodosilinea nodulosa TaxID=416001 RepID=UPI00036F1752|nr:hypothetical protein [Nodosilinea nodulosa]
MIGILAVVAFITIIAAPIYLDEKKAQLRKKLERDMFSEPSPWGDPDDADMIRVQAPELLLNQGFSGSADPVQVKFVKKITDEEREMLNALAAMARVSDPAFSHSLLETPEAESNLAKLRDFCSTANDEQIQAWMRETGPWPNIDMPDFEISETELKRLVKIFFLIRKANRFGFSQRIISEDMLHIAKGGSKAYTKFKTIFDTIREFEIPYMPD